MYVIDGQENLTNFAIGQSAQERAGGRHSEGSATSPRPTIRAPTTTTHVSELGVPTKYEVPAP